MKTISYLKTFALFLAIGITSCSSDDSGSGSDIGGDNGGDPSALVLSVDQARNYTDENVTFNVVDGTGLDVTSQATITIDGVDITGNRESFSTVGIKSAVATIGSNTSNTVNVDIIVPSFTTKMIIEDFTGQWCPFCPRISKAIEDLHAGPNGDNYIAVAVHNRDDFSFPLEAQLRSQFGISSWPTGLLNRDIAWTAISTDNMNSFQPSIYLSETQPVGLAINSSISGNSVDATVKVGFDLDQSDLKLVVFLLENDRVAYQQNNTSHYGGLNRVNNFVHNEILRANFTDIFGDVIPAADQVGGSEYTADLTVNIPSGTNTSNMEVVAFVVDDSGKVMNAQRAEVGVNQDFD